MRKTKLIYIYLVITAFLLIDLIATINLKLSLAGYWSDRILFWSWFFLTIYTIKTYWKNKWAKRYFYALLAFIILTIIPMAMPFAGILLSTTGQGLIYNKQISDKYRFEITQYGFMGRPSVDICENKIVFEKEIASLKQNESFQANDSTYIEPWEVENVNFIGEDKDSIFLDVFKKGLVSKISIKKSK